jgi:Domain of unknown function (DUF4304)
MSERDVIQRTFDEFGNAAGATKKSGSWFRRGPETIVVLNLQKSDYGDRYFVNVALWLLPLGPASAPKENVCHIRSRLSQLVPREMEEQVNELFDLNIPIDAASRRERLIVVLRENLLPLIDNGSTLEGLRSARCQHLIERSLVTEPARRLLDGQSFGT